MANNQQICLMYHDVYRNSPVESGFVSYGANHYKLNINLFREHLSIIKKVAPETILTFDDGGVSFYTEIAPCLEDFGFKGHFYIATDYIGTETFMNRGQIADLYKRGHIIGAHSSSHPENMDNLTIEQKMEEWKKSILTLSEIIGKQVTEVSIPNGFYNMEDLQLLSGMGIKNIYTSSISDYKIFNGTSVIGRIALKQDSSVAILKKYLERGFQYRQLYVKQKAINLSKYILGSNYLMIKRWLCKIYK